VVKYRKIPPAAAAHQMAENARIPPAADLQKNKNPYCTSREQLRTSRAVETLGRKCNSTGLWIYLFIYLFKT
jgi:hypothetical protein